MIRIYQAVNIAFISKKCKIEAIIGAGIVAQQAKPSLVLLLAHITAGLKS